jgi:hypothetical protein
MFAVRSFAAVGFFASVLLGVGFGCVLLAAAFQFGIPRFPPQSPGTQLDVLLFQFGDPCHQLFDLTPQFLHGLRSVPSNQDLGKRNSLDSPSCLRSL